MQHDSLCTAKLPQIPFAEPLARAAAAVHRLALAVARRTEPLARRDARFALALQGGGALGAFTWGVLDRLLEVPGFSPDAISVASAGVANGEGLGVGPGSRGAAGAKEAPAPVCRAAGMFAEPGRSWHDAPHLWTAR